MSDPKSICQSCQQHYGEVERLRQALTDLDLYLLQDEQAEIDPPRTAEQRQIIREALSPPEALNDSANGVVVVSVVDGLRELEPQLSDDAEIIAHVLPLLLNVVEAAEKRHAIDQRTGFDASLTKTIAAAEKVGEALAALESAQAADSPERGAGA